MSEAADRAAQMHQLVQSITGDNPDALCDVCRGGRYCVNCLGWSDVEIPCTFCDNTGDCAACQGTGEKRDDE